MVSKCANPECSERFLYLHQGRIFQLTPAPEIAVGGGFAPQLYERFWLCDKCSKTMTLVWGGTEAELVPLPAKTVVKISATPAAAQTKLQPKTRTASAGRNRH